MERFKLVSTFKPRGDQERAIQNLYNGLRRGEKHLVLRGVTGSGKTFTVANVIEKVNRPTLVISHNKTLAAQLYNEYKSFFPENRVEFFVSYYDYYQPEAYIASTDTYIEKDCSINNEIDRLRHSSTFSVLTRKDTIIVSSVSCIYNLGSPDTYEANLILLRKGENIDREGFLHKLVEILYERNDLEFLPGRFRVKGDVIDVFPMYSQKAVRIELFGDELERISYFDPLKVSDFEEISFISIYPAKHYLTLSERVENGLEGIRLELEERLKYFDKENKVVEKHRLKQRTLYDIEMIREIGYCKGIENYSRHFDGRRPGDPPLTLIDYFPDDMLFVIDESHVTIPQIKGMYNGDHSRKVSLIENGFRLPSAFDNRPLKFEEFKRMQTQALYTSATPAEYELEISEMITEQVIRPTGLVDPEIKIYPTANQIDNLLIEINKTIKNKERVLITTLTKKMAEDLAQYLKELEYKVSYLHSEVETLERFELIRDLRLGNIDILVGVNLLREGLDLPEVSLIAIFDADKEGFLRSETSLIQTIGRAARNVNGKIIMFADNLTNSMNKAIKETNRRREIQIKYNEEHGIHPETIISSIKEGFRLEKKGAKKDRKLKFEIPKSFSELDVMVSKFESEMKKEAKALNFEKAAELRDLIIDLKKHMMELDL
ncbi:MAG TPA: excinuclease ABC subunit UvrB [Firmicutes bacterium]|nr:excinuclease ABC subunit UvrB [Bacillota bacterium]